MREITVIIVENFYDKMSMVWNQIFALNNTYWTTDTPFKQRQKDTSQFVWLGKKARIKQKVL